jgi:uncharacterized protein
MTALRPLVTLLGLCFVTATACASGEARQPEAAFPIPDRYSLVNDNLGILLISKSIEITNKLQALERRNGTQIVFLSVPSIGGEGPYSYAVRVAEKWDIGNNGQGNGVLFLVTQREGTYILVGPGIGGAIPDVKVARIFREIIEPHWRREEYSEGIEQAIDALILAARGEDTAPTFYDYLHPIVPTRPERWLIAVLVTYGVGHATFLCWRWRKKRRTLT